MGEAERPKRVTNVTHVSLGHEVLFSDAGDTSGPSPAADSDDAARCDVCDLVVVVAGDDDADEGAAIPGHAYYVWTRGEVQRREEAPICASCAVALGMSALGRWEIEEEEG